MPLRRFGAPFSAVELGKSPPVPLLADLNLNGPKESMIIRVNPYPNTNPVS
jgi:hypothetical protein